MNPDDRDLLADLSDEELALLEGIDDLLADDSLYAEPSNELEDSIMALVEADMTGPVGTTEPPVSHTSMAPVVDLAARRRSRGRVLAPWLLAAAAAVAAVTVVATRPGGHSAEVEVALAATDLAPGASGTIGLSFEESGTRIDLDATGLGTAPPGFFYQGWVKGDRGLVSIGTFHTPDKVILWAGVDLADYPTLTVTLEPEDGDQTSSGQVVLKAPVGDVAANR